MAKTWKKDRHGVIRFSVTSDGTTGPQWIPRLMKMGKRISDYGMGSLLSPDFKPTRGVTTKVVVLPGEMFFKEEDRATTERIRDEARPRLGAFAPNAETACLTREMFSDEDLKDMGFVYIAVCHEPIRVYGCHVPGHPNILSVSRHGYGHWLDAFSGKPDRRWNRHGAFAFDEG